MEPPAVNPFERKIATMIGALGRRWRRRELQRGGVLTAVGLLAWLLAMILLDNLLILTSGQLLLGWLMLLAAATLAGLALAYRLTVARPAADRLALLFEARVPGHQNRLINAVQFLATRKQRQDPLVQALIVENALALDLRRVPQALDARALRAAARTAVVVAVLLGGYALVRPQWAANGLARLLSPLSPAAHLLATEPHVRPGDVEVVEGQPLAIEADIQPSLRGTLPERVELEYRVGPLPWASTPMTRGARQPSQSPAASSSTTFAHTFSAVWQPIEYRVRAGRSESPLYQVRVQARPRISELHVTITRPAYAGGERRTLKANVGDVSALLGSTIELQLVASTALADGHIELPDGSVVALAIGGSTDATGHFTLERSGSYAIHLTDTRGLPNVNPPRYTLTAEPDQPPVVAITRPGRDLVLPINSTLELQIEAEDDIGLTRVVLQTRRGEEPWQDARTFETSQCRFTAEARLALGEMGLQVNDVLLYRAIAQDNRRPQPNTGVGRTWSVAIAEADKNDALLAAQTRRLLDALQRMLELQRQNRSELDLDREVDPIRARQQEVRDLAADAVDKERKAVRPTESVIGELVSLADGPMLQAVQQLAAYGGEYKQRAPLKPPILQLMDDIIARLTALIGKLRSALESAENAQQVLAQLPEQERGQALQDIRDLLKKLRDFLPDQDRVIADTEELVRKAGDFTDEDRQKLEQVKGTEDKWADALATSVKDIAKLTEQGFADRSIANDYKEMVEQIEEASKNLTPQLVQLAVPREQSGRELAESLVEEMEMWLPNSPDNIKWMMEEPLDFPEIPMVDLPDQLSDLIGDLIESQDELNEAAEDMTSAWADSIAAGAGWEVAGGPISNFSAVGKTGNQLPDNNELSGRSGEGRSGRSQGQLVQDVARGLQGRQTPTRVTNDTYEQGVVKELQQMATGGSTGGGKARGAGQEGLQGETPPPLYKDLKYMQDWQQRIRQQAERVAGQLQVVRVELPSLEQSIALMRRAEQAATAGRYADMFRAQQMVLQHLRAAGDLAAREVALRLDRAEALPPDQRRQMLDALDEPVPEEYQAAVRRYFEQLSETR